MEKKTKIVLPVLITKNFVVFPTSKDERIDAGRDFSIKAINASKENNSSLLLVVSQIDSTVENPTSKDLYKIGTLCRIISLTDMKQYLRIRVTGTQRVKFNSVTLSEDGYYVGTCSPMEDIPGDEKTVLSLTKTIMSTIQTMPQVMNAMPRATFVNLTTHGVLPGELCDILAPYLPMKHEKRQEILEAQNIQTRLELIANSISIIQTDAELDAEISKKVSASTEQAQRDYLLREKLKVIKDELNNGQEGNDEDTVRDRLEKNPYPENIKKRINAELKKYEMMPQASLESSLIMSYVQTLLDIPWYQKTEDNDDLNNVQKILDEDHYGLTDVKKRILEYLAVKKLTGNLKAPILCFYGPPGCGKTSLGKSIARALGRKFFKASLGGISDEAEIRGHRRTYVGSMPGRIIAGMKKCGVVNPVFLLDEIDKLASSYKGDPASAMLEVLDPEQNFQFNDNYVEEPYDLSNVLFICTANYLENIPAPLRDRLELIEVNSYTELEKLKIAKNFLFKKQLTLNGLTSKNIAFTDEAYLEIIRRYTVEAGVRSLERNIATVMRKVCVELLTNKDFKKVNVTPTLVQKYLDKPIFDFRKKENDNQVGVVTGLAYTQAGGDILPIEVTYFPGKGGLVLTGSLGDVMKESATIAIDYVRANAKKYGIDDKIFEKNNIHIHFPEGAIPKDGPSAGVAITTAIVSCLTNTPVSNIVAMTGEVNLRGKALPIGGLREKTLAALRSGIKTVIVPKKNEPDIVRLPDEVKNNLEIIYMECVDDALKIALVK